jgi:hypothetical protein
LFLLPSCAFIAKKEESSENTSKPFKPEVKWGLGGGGGWESVIENIVFISGKTEILRL